MGAYFLAAGRHVHVQGHTSRLLQSHVEHGRALPARGHACWWMLAPVQHAMWREAELSVLPACIWTACWHLAAAVAAEPDELAWQAAAAAAAAVRRVQARVSCPAANESGCSRAEAGQIAHASLAAEACTVATAAAVAAALGRQQTLSTAQLVTQLVLCVSR